MLLFRKGSLSLNDTPAASGPACVWLVLFDPLPELQPHIPAVAFDDLESRSLVFEQYLIQDIREQATLDDYLGGAETVGKQAGWPGLAVGHTVWLQLGNDNASTEMPSQGIFRAPALTAALQPRIFPLSAEHSDVFPEPLAAAIAGARFVLVTVRLPGPASEQLQSANDVLTRLEKLAAAPCGGQTTPVWLVTGFRGVARPAARPFESGADESQLHVPLWWTEPLSAGTRLQSLCGSFDLLPTLMELFQGNTGSTVPDTAVGTAAAIATGETAGALSEPLSLLSSLLQGSKVGERLLRLRHDAWQGLRTSQYFLVQPLRGPDEEDADPGEFAGQQLYLKPEDYWNVNNSIVSFAEIAREMADGV